MCRPALELRSQLLGHRAAGEVEKADVGVPGRPAKGFDMGGLEVAVDDHLVAEALGSQRGADLHHQRAQGVSH